MIKRRRLRGSTNGFRAPASGERDLADVVGDEGLSVSSSELVANNGEERSAVFDDSSGSSSMGVIGGGGVSGTSSDIENLDRRDRRWW